MNHSALLATLSFPLALTLALSSTVSCGGDGGSGGGGGSATTSTGGTATGGSGTGGATGGSGTGGVTGGSGTGGGATGGSGGTGGMSGGGTGGVGGSGGATQAGLPQIGAHGLSYYRYAENNLVTIGTPAMDTQAAGSTIVVSAGRGDFSAFALPTDNKGNSPYKQLGQAHTYTKWPTSGTALYAFEDAVGGPGHVVSNSTPAGDEITLTAVEVKGGTHIQDFQWNERLADGQPITTLPVTTTGPATLVAFWWGDGNAPDNKVAVPNNGFTVLDSIGLEGSLVQCFVAAKEVDAAGTYDVTWNATPVQGAQLWLVAVQ